MLLRKLDSVGKTSSRMLDILLDFTGESGLISTLLFFFILVHRRRVQR